MITEDGIEILQRFVPSCSIGSPMLSITRILKHYDGKDVPEISAIKTIAPFKALFEKAQQTKGPIDGQLIVDYFCSQDHYQDIADNGTTVAAEIPDEFVALLHTGLPLTDNKYINDNVCLELGGLIRIGKAGNGGFWIAHLAAEFWVPFSDRFKAELLNKQKGIPVFLETARRLTSFDYSVCPGLLRGTAKAIKELTIQ